MAGKKLVFQYKDDGSQPAQAAEAAREFVKNSAIQVIIGPNFTGACEAARQITEAAGRLMYCQSGAPFTYTPLFFAAQASPELSLWGLPLEFFKEKGWTRVACLATADSSGAAYGPLSKYAAAFGVKIVANETFQPGATDVTAQLTRIRQANPDVIYSCASGANLAPVVQGVKQLGLPYPVFAGFGSATEPVAKLVRGSLPSGGLYSVGNWVFLPKQIPQSYPGRSALESFISGYKKLSGGTPPDIIGPAAVDSLNLIAKAVNSGKSMGPAIAKYIQNVKDYQGLLANYTFSKTDHRGAKLENVIMQWKSNGFTLAAQPSLAAAQAGLGTGG